MSPDDVAAVADVVAELIRDALAPVLERLAVIDARLEDLTGEEAAIGPLRERLAVVEAKAARPESPPIDLTPVLERVAKAEARLDTVAPVTSGLAALSERVAIVETRAPVPGPAGVDGAHGKDGADGLGFEDLDVKFDGYNLLTFEFARAGVVKGFPVSLPFLRYQGVHQDGQKYFQGDVTTWAGSTWHCNEPTTTKPGDGSKAWTLMVKRGRDGRDGVDAPGALPVVSVGKRT